MAHRSTLRAAGFTNYRIRAELAAGTLRRVGRDRVATMDAPGQLIAAASTGTRVTCVSAARMYGLWVPNDGVLHLSAPVGYSTRGSPRPGTVLHWARVPIPPDRDSAIEPLLNVLVHISECQSLEYAAAAFDSALNKRLIAEEELRQLAAVLGRRFAEVASLSDRRADSGGETLPRVRLARRGVVMRPQAIIDGHPVDGVVGKWLVIQVDGYAHHSDPKQRARDLAQDRRMAQRGYTVFRYPSWTVEHELDRVEQELMDAIAQGLHEHPHRAVE